MLRSIRGGQRWLTLLFVIGIGGVFVLFLGLQGPMNFAGSPSRVVVVGPHSFDVADFERARAGREAQMAEQFGGQVPDSPAIRNGLDNQAVQELVETGLLALAAEDLGLTVSKREIERLWLGLPGLRDESGRFDRETFDYFVEREYGSQSIFLEAQRRALLATKMLRVLSSLPEVSEGEARAALERELAEVKLATLVIRPDPEATPEVGEAEVAAAIETRGPDLQALFTERANEYDRPERVSARHILVTVPRDADEAQVAEARAKLEAAAARIAAGEEFAAVAEEVSDDTGSAVRGGDLGFFGRGQMVPDFESAAFALAAGETSEPVRSDFGWHLIRVEEREDAVLIPYEDAREELARALLEQEAAREAARARAEALAERVAAGETLEALAAAEGLDLDRSGWLRRGADSSVPGLGSAPELLAEAFALEPGEASPELFEVGERFALVQTLEARPADAEQVTDRLETRRETLLAAKREARVGAWVDERRKALLDAGELSIDLSPIRGT